MLGSRNLCHCVHAHLCSRHLPLMLDSKDRGRWGYLWQLNAQDLLGARLCIFSHSPFAAGTCQPFGWSRQAFPCSVCHSARTRLHLVPVRLIPNSLVGPGANNAWVPIAALESIYCTSFLSTPCTLAMFMAVVLHSSFACCFEPS